MKNIPIDKLIQTCLDTLRMLDFKESVIKRHYRQFLHLKNYMKSNGKNLYNENVGEKYQFDLLSEGKTQSSRLKVIKYSINLLILLLDFKKAH